MAKKGSKYARKHLFDEPSKQRNEFEGEAFYEVIYDDHLFLDVFSGLELPEQIKAYQVLKKLAETSVKGVSRAEKKLILNSRDKLDAINKSAGLKTEEMLRYPLSADEHHIIRMDCYGTVDYRPNHQLSSFYKDILKHPLDERLSPNDYDLENAPMWKVFRQFKNFRKIEPQIKEYLSNNNVDPYILKVMGVKDFSDIIFKAFRKENEHKVSFTEGDSERNAFVKELVKAKGDVIYDILDAHGYDRRYIYSLINAMKSYGTTDASHIIITETHFTEKTLTDLEKAKIPVKDYNVGDEIPQDLVDYLFRHDQGMLIAARDEKLNLLKSSEFPSFEVHHKVAVSESGRLPCLAQVNYRNNYLLVESNIHQIVLHGYDKLVVQEGKEAYRCRMEFEDTYLSFMAGFNSDDKISVNWNDYEEIQEKETEDQKYLVSYEDCLEELKRNRRLQFDTRQSSDDFNVDNVAKNLRSKYASGKMNKTKKTYLKKMREIEK